MRRKIIYLILRIHVTRSFEFALELFQDNEVMELLKGIE